MSVQKPGAAAPNIVGPGGTSPDAGIIAGQVTNWLNTHTDAKPITGGALKKLETELANPKDTQKFDVTPEFELGVGRTLYVHTNKDGTKAAYLEETSTDLNATQRWIKLDGFQMPAAFPRQLTAADVPAHQPGGTIQKTQLPPWMPQPSAIKGIYANDIKQSVTNGTAKECPKPSGTPEKIAGRSTFSIPVFSVEGKNGSHIEVPYNLTGFVIGGELYAINKDTEPHTYLDCGRAPVFM
jgi:hypothetical protein